MTFKELGLREELLSAIEKLGFEQPTPIQSEAIPFLLEDSERDLIALAQTGTGKTAAFSLPVLSQIDIEDKRVQLLVLCPTRELCLQIARDIESYTTQLRSLKTIAVYGGTSVSQQKKQLKKGAHIVVGTPGRTLDLIKQRALDVSKIKWLTLDEADEMLSMGFQDDLESILAGTPDDKQNLLFSATMPKAMTGMVKRFMTNPHTIKVARQNIGNNNVEHHFYVTQSKNRYATLQRLVDAYPDMYAIIFCRTRRETQEVANRLMQMDYNADTIHGDLSQNQRDQVMKNFRDKTIQILVATDVAARGIDVDSLTHVINYQLPDDPEVYVHRSGRTGRAGREGVSICIIHSREGRKLSTIEKMVGKTFEKKLIPTGEEICEKQIEHFLEEIRDHQSNHNLIEQYWPMIQEKIGDLSGDEIINRLLGIEISRFLQVYENAPDLNMKLSKKYDHDDVDDGKKKRKSSGKWVGYELSTGSKQNMNPKRLIALINEQTDSNDIAIGEIIVKVKNTYFEIDASKAKRIEEAFDGIEFGGQPALKKATRKPEKTQRAKRGQRDSGGGRRSGNDSRGGRRGGNSRSGSRSGGSRGRRR